MCFWVQVQGTPRLNTSIALLCGAGDNGDSIDLLSTYFVAGRVFYALHTLFCLILLAVLQGGETGSGRETLAKVSQQAFAPAPWPLACGGEGLGEAQLQHLPEAVLRDQGL